ncbi:MAG: HypC/HybG/HupF family hydrogenase formation chaperone [Candidatus ainarchaeum sp.]|nr:HypC/HybG/HupF family hydrogenase formation chaperone [Candidatus ainarchaeum sp.]
MCLAVPGKVVGLKRKGKIAVIDYGPEKREAANLIKAKIGDRVIVQHRNVVEKT